MINYEYSFIFVHIPKTAGISVREWLIANTGDKSLRIWHHPTIKDYARVLQSPFFEKAFKFAFVRNPWDRTVSYYHFGRDSEGFGARNPTLQKHFREKTFSQCVKDGHIFEPQKLYLTNRRGDLALDFIGRFERLEEDTEYIAQRLQLETIRPFKSFRFNSSKHRPYQYYYDKTTRDIVAEAYQWEIEQFGYTFEPIKTL